MSTLLSQPDPAPAWKQEVNRRVAAHKSRKGAAEAEPNGPGESRRPAASRAAQAAARVAARYATAPSYSELLTAEARVAVRSAAIATQVAIEAQAAAQAALADLHAASRAASAPQLLLEAPERLLEPDMICAEPTPLYPQHPQTIPIHQEPEWVESIEGQATDGLQRELEALDLPAGHWWEPAAWELVPQPLQLPEPPHANLIEFPRELKATRKLRRGNPGEHPAKAMEAEGQLSIYEVDPVLAPEQAATASSPAPAPAFDWSSIELDAQPLDAPETEQAESLTQPHLEMAPLNRRFMAVLVDGALIAGAFLAAALVTAAKVDRLPPLHLVEMGAVASLAALVGLYQAIFLILGEATPGMKYARLALCTFDNQFANRAQRCKRLCALLLSVLPLGLGLAWTLFDENHLSWHDRLSCTYQRVCLV